MHRQFAASAGSLYEVKTAHPIVCCLCYSRATRLRFSDCPRSAHPPRDSQNSRIDFKWVFSLYQSFPLDFSSLFTDFIRTGCRIASECYQAGPFVGLTSSLGRRKSRLPSEHPDSHSMVSGCRQVWEGSFADARSIGWFLCKYCPTRCRRIGCKGPVRG